MKRVVLLLLCILFLVLDNTLAPFFSIKGIYPSILFTFIILFSIINGYWESTFVGVLAGVLQDSYFIHCFGINCFSNVLLCILASFIGSNIYKQRRFVPVIIMFLMTILKYIIIYFMGKVLNVIVPIQGIFIMAFYNMIIGLFIYGWVYRLSNKDFMKRQWKFSEK